MSQNKLLFTIYSNLFEFIKYRGLSAVEEPKLYEEFVNTITTKNNVFINTNENILIVLIYSDAELLKTPELKKLFKLIPSTINELILVSKDSISNSSVIKQMKTTANYNICNYKYSHFKIIIPKHIYVPEHSILPEEEHEYLLNNVLITHKNRLAIILLNDPQCIWLGAKIGDIIKIKRKSEVAGYAYYYRIVK